MDEEETSSLRRMEPVERERIRIRFTLGFWRRCERRAVRWGEVACRVLLGWVHGKVGRLGGGKREEERRERGKGRYIGNGGGVGVWCCERVCGNGYEG